jgi:putative membrane protein
MPNRLYQCTALLGALALLNGGCKPKSTATVGSADTAATGAVPGGDTARMGTPDTSAKAAMAAGGTLSDANIVALLDGVNKADSSAGALAAKKATNPEVKAFARLMMSEHHALRVQGQALAKKVKITPEPPAEDPFAAPVQDEVNALQSAPKGAQFDKTYIDKEVGIHQAVKDVLDKAHSAAQNEELKKLIEKAQPVIQKHLDQAEALQKKLPANA